MANWHYLPESNQVIWYSERTDWGQLYMYDLASGRLEHAITTGARRCPGAARRSGPRRDYFTARARERRSYFESFYRVNFDGSGFQSLTPRAPITSSRWRRRPILRGQLPTPQTPGGHGGARRRRPRVATSTGRRSRASWPPAGSRRRASWSRRATARLISTVACSRPRTWCGQRYRSSITSTPAPQTGSVGTRSFVASRGDDQALAELVSWWSRSMSWARRCAWTLPG